MGKDRSQSEYAELIDQWRLSVSLYRRLCARLGLQGKLVVCFFLLLAAGSGLACWMFAQESGQQLKGLMGEQARQLSSTLALTCQNNVRDQDWKGLTATAQDVVRSRNILFVVFLNKDSMPRAMATRDPSAHLSDLAFVTDTTRTLMQVRSRSSSMFGDYIDVLAPVLATNNQNGMSLVGYVAVGMSQKREMAQLTRINWMIAGINGIVVILSLPLVYVLVHRVFLPIRELVQATRRITDGDMEAHVAVHRPDVIGVLARSFNDMTIVIRRQQQALAEANRDLERRIEQRTSQLEAANQRLSSEIAEKEDFLRAVSHDLNAPLRNISGMASMLLMKHRDNFDEDIVHRLERIQKNVEVETDLIAELLELSRIKTRRQKMERVSISELVADLRGLFESDLKSKGIDLIIDQPLPALTCERGRIRQVFQNLIDNAIKYMGDPANPAIHIGCDIRRTEIEFYVRDTGIGIEPEEIDKIFCVFRRGRNTQLQNIAGKGVGLASVKSIVETHNGKIWVESQVGKGSTFHFTISTQFVPASGAEEQAKAA